MPEYKSVAKDRAARSPYNMVHLILPQALPGDDRLQNRYTRAAALFPQWQREQVLVRDPESALYYWETDFEHQGQVLTRKGWRPWCAWSP